MTLAEVRQGTRWKVEPTPTPTGQAGVQGVLTGVSCSSPTACSAVGNHISDAGHQVTLAETWNGTAWKIVPAPVAGRVSTLSGVSCPAAGHCTAVGVDYGSYQFTPPDTDAFSLAGAWNGTSWTAEPAPSPAGLIFNSLSAISCAFPTACAAVGYQQATGLRLAFSEIWNGARWAIQLVPVPAGSDYSELDAVSCASATSCVAVGDYQTTSSPGESPLSAVWNGSRWTMKTVPVRSGATTTQLSGISCRSATFCTAVGWDDAAAYGETLAETWNGTAWTVHSTPNPGDSAGSALTAVSCASATSCSAVGDYITGASPELSLAEYWNGTAWTLQSTPEASGTDTYLTGVSCPAPGTCTASGWSGAGTTLVAVLKAGTWTVAATPSPGQAGSDSLLAVSCSIDHGVLRGRGIRHHLGPRRPPGRGMERAHLDGRAGLLSRAPAFRSRSTTWPACHALRRPGAWPADGTRPITFRGRTRSVR